MENIMTVVSERDEAFNLLETGKTGDPGGRYLTNFLGLTRWKKNSEHLVPPYMNKFYTLLYPRRVSKRTEKYIALYWEQQRNERRKERNREARKRRKILEKFPHLRGTL